MDALGVKRCTPSPSYQHQDYCHRISVVIITTGHADVMRRQATYAGAIGAPAMYELQDYGNGQPECDGNAYTLVPAYNSGYGSLGIYVTHLAQSATSRSTT